MRSFHTNKALFYYGLNKYFDWYDYPDGSKLDIEGYKSIYYDDLIKLREKINEEKNIDDMNALIDNIEEYINYRKCLRDDFAWGAQIMQLIKEVIEN